MNSTLVLFYHRIPHVYKNFTKLSKSHYSLRNQLYIESLGIIGTLPAIILIIILINLLIYLLSFSCCFKAQLRQSRRNFVFNKVLLFLLCGCCCTTIGFSLYFNDELNNSVGKLATLVKEYEEAVEGIGNSTTESQTIISSNIQLNLNNIERNYHEQQENTTETQSILKYLQSINYNLSSTWDEFNLIGGGLNTNRYSQLISIGERFRWFTVLSFYILFILINLLLIYGLVKNSKCSFITFSVLGLLVLIVNWCVVSGWLVVAVGTADTCSERNTTLLTELIPVEEIRTHLASVSFLLNSIRETTKELRSLINFNYNFNYIEINIINLFEYYSTIELSVGAIETHLSSIYTNYLIFKSSLCSTTLMHVHWLLVLNIGASFVLSLLIYIDSYVWIYLIQMGSGKRSPGGGTGAKSMDEKYGEPSCGDKSRNSRVIRLEVNQEPVVVEFPQSNPQPWTIDTIPPSLDIKMGSTRL